LTQRAKPETKRLKVGQETFKFSTEIKQFVKEHSLALLDTGMFLSRSLFPAQKLLLEMQQNGSFIILKLTEY